MKYKVGDKVRVKSLEWYNENKNKWGSVACFADVSFVPAMAKLCNCMVTIERVNNYTYKIKESKHKWTDDMFEDDDMLVDIDDYDYEFQRAIAKAVDECLWGMMDEINVYKETDPTKKLVDDSVEFGKNVMQKKISEYLLKYLPMTPDDKENFVEEMFKNIK